MLLLVTQLCLTLRTPGTVANHAPLSMGFSRQGYWSGLPFPSPRDLPDPGLKSRSPTVQMDFFFLNLLNHQESPRGTLHKRGLICHGSWHMREDIYW